MKKRYILIILATVLMLSSLLYGVKIFVGNKKQMEVERAEGEYELLSAELASKMQVYLVNITGRLKGAADVASGMLNESDERSYEDLFASLREIKTELGLNEIYYCDTKGNAVSVDGESFDVSFCPYYERALLGDMTITYSGVVYEEAPGYIVNVPVKVNGQVAGVIRAELNEKDVTKNLSITAYKGREKILLLNRNAEVIAATAGLNLSDYKTFLDIFYKDSEAKAQFETTIRQGRSLFLCVDEKISVGAFGKKPYYMAYAGIPGSSEWGVMMILDESTALSFYQSKELTDSEYKAMLFLGIVALLSMGAGLYALLETISRNKMYNLAYFDETADTMNVNFFRQKASQALEKNTSSQYAMVVMGIEKYEYLKSFFGENEISRILKEISAVLKSSVKRDELFCHNFAEEFELLLVYHNADELKDRIKFMSAVLEDVKKVEGNSDKYALNFKFGVALKEKDAADYDVLISRATLAYMAAKGQPSGIMELYTEKMQSRMLDEKEIENDMYEALENREFLVYLQPKFDLKTGLQSGAEALVRWMHPAKGLMYPGRFIATFEKNGFITKLDMYMLEELCRRLKVWISKGYRPMPLSINISQQNLFNPDFVREAMTLVEKYGVSANLIVFEIAEREVAENMDILKKIMEEMKSYGFVVSMDGFGTGNTSMNTLYNVPVDELKIDRKFLLSAEKTNRGQNVIQSIIEMAKRLDINVVSEGVENKQQAMLLRELGCDMIQGFAFSEPLPEHEYEEYAYGARSKENRIW